MKDEHRVSSVLLSLSHRPCLLILVRPFFCRCCRNWVRRARQDLGSFVIRGNLDERDSVSDLRDGKRSLLSF
jgi:hypothetical protein